MSATSQVRSWDGSSGQLFRSQGLVWAFSCASPFISPARATQMRKCWVFKCLKGNTSIRFCADTPSECEKRQIVEVEDMKGCSKREREGGGWGSENWPLTDSFDQDVLCEARLWLGCTHQTLRSDSEAPRAAGALRRLRLESDGKLPEFLMPSKMAAAAGILFSSGLQATLHSVRPAISI